MIRITDRNSVEIQKYKRNTTTTFTAIVKRDYQLDNNRTLSTVILKKNNRRIGRVGFKFYELNKTYKGVENVDFKTCIKEGDYLAEWFPDTKTPKFSRTGIYLLYKVPGRCQIILHYGGSRKEAHLYTEGCLMPYKELIGNTIRGSLDEMRRFVKLTRKENVLFRITS